MLEVMDLSSVGAGVFAVGIGYAGGDDILRPLVGFGSADGQGMWARLVTDVRFEQYGTAACGSPEQSVAFMNRTDEGIKIRATRYSADRRTVSAATASDGSFSSADSQTVKDCQWTGDEFVAIGVTADADNLDGSIWQSSDGVSWSAAHVPSSMAGDGDQWLYRLAPFRAGGDHGAGLIVVGEDLGRHDGSVLWVLLDDAWWFVENPMGVDSPKDVRIDDVVIGDGQIVATGVNRRTEHIWTASLESLLASLSVPG